MPNFDELFTTEKLRALLANEAITPTERVYRALVALSDRLDTVHIEALEGKKMVGALAGVVKDTIAAPAKLPVPPADDSDTAVAASNVPPNVGRENKVKDSTPFPAGVSATVGGAPVAPVPAAPTAAPAPTAPAQSAAPGPIVDGEDLTPNVGSGPATNAQPIPGSRANAPAPTLNQSKVTKVTKNANA